MTADERTNTFIKNFLTDLYSLYECVLAHEKMLFDVALNRTFFQNLKTLKESPMKPAFARTTEQIAAGLQLQTLTLTQSQHDQCQQAHMSPQEYVCAKAAANEKNRQNFWEVFGCSSFKEGNCTAIPMAILMRQKDNPLHDLLADKDIYVNPVRFVRYLKEKRPSFVYETDETHDFAQIFSEKKAKTGSLVVVVMRKAYRKDQSTKLPQSPDGMLRGHMLVCSKLIEYPNGNIEPQYISFDSERKNHTLSKWKQCGYVIDLPRMIKSEYESQQQQLKQKQYCFEM